MLCSSNSKNSSKDNLTVAKEQAPKSIVDTKPSGQKKTDTYDLLDELFCDPNTINKTEPTSSSSTSEKANGKETKPISDSKSSSTVAVPSVSSLPTLDTASASTQSPTDVKDEDTVKSKVKKADSQGVEKAGSTNKPRKLPDWLAGATSSVGAASSTSSKAPTSRKRKAPSSNASSTAKRTKAASPIEDKDSDTLPNPPPTKKVSASTLYLTLS